MTRDELRHRASEARRLLDEPLLIEAFDNLEEAVLAELLSVRGAEPEDDRKRRMLLDRLHVLQDVRSHLQLTIAEGKSAALQGEYWA